MSSGLNLDNDEIKDMYVRQKMSSVEIGKILGCSNRTILNRLEEMSIHRRSLPDAQHANHKKEHPPELKSYDTMHQLYEVERKTKDELGEMFNVSPACVGRCLQRLGIHVRSNSEATIGTRTGEDHHNWKGGQTRLQLRLREFHATNLAPKARERDLYTCQLCGSHSNLHTHHIIPLSVIISNICEEHPELDIIKDVNTLYEIITTDEQFLDIGNLITYCKDCHFYRIHNYRKSISSEAS